MNVENIHHMIKVVKLTIQEDDSSGSFVQHVCDGGLRGEFTWEGILTICFININYTQD